MAVVEWRARWPRGIPGGKKQKRAGCIKMRQMGSQGGRIRKRAPGPDNLGLLVTNGYELSRNPPLTGRINAMQLKYIQDYVKKGLRLLGPLVGQSRMAQLRAELEVRAQNAWRNR